MLRSTDFQLTCPIFVSSLAEGMSVSFRMARKSALLTAVAALAVVAVVGVASQSVVLGIVGWLGFIAIAAWHIARRAHADMVGEVIEARRAWEAARGLYAAPLGPSPAATRVMMALFLLAAMPVLPGLGLMLMRRLLAQEWTRLAANSTWSQEARAGGCNATLHLYLCYPDHRYNVPSGYHGVWFPEGTLDARRKRIAVLLFPLLLAAVSGLVGALALALTTLQFSAWVAVPFVTFFLAAGATSAASMTLSTQFLHVLLAAPLEQLSKSQRRLLPTAANEWEECVQRVSNSTFEADGFRLSEHVFLGWIMPTWSDAPHPLRTRAWNDTPSPMPLLVHRSIIGANCHITGATQSGKTIIAQLSLVLQVIRGHLVPQLDAHGKQLFGLDGEPLWSPAPPAPVLVIDLKRDLAFYNSIKEECARLGRTFREFTLEEGCQTAYFNPIRDLTVTGRPVIEFCELVMEMLSLFHGLSYGRSYYSKQSRDLLVRTLQKARAKPLSWGELYQLLHDELDHSQHKDVFELLSSIFALAQYPVLGPAPAGAEAIHMPSVIANCEVVYFCLPARTSAAMSIRDVAKMALYCFMAAADEWNIKRGDRRSFCFVDEPQIISSRNLGTVFQQCSGANVVMALSNQAPIDLNTEDAPHLADIVHTNTRVKVAFNILDVQESRAWREASGEIASPLRSRSVSKTVSTGASGSSTTHGITNGEHDTVHNRLDQNLIIQANNTPGEALVHIATSAGFTQLNGLARRVRLPWVMDLREYQRRRYTPWPTAPKQGAVATSAATAPVNTSTPKQIEERAQNEYAALESLYKRLSGRRTQRVKVDASTK